MVALRAFGRLGPRIVSVVRRQLQKRPDLWSRCWPPRSPRSQDASDRQIDGRQYRGRAFDDFHPGWIAVIACAELCAYPAYMLAYQVACLRTRACATRAAARGASGGGWIRPICARRRLWHRQAGAARTPRGRAQRESTRTRRSARSNGLCWHQPRASWPENDRHDARGRCQHSPFERAEREYAYSRCARPRGVRAAPACRCQSRRRAQMGRIQPPPLAPRAAARVAHARVRRQATCRRACRLDRRTARHTRSQRSIRDGSRRTPARRYWRPSIWRSLALRSRRSRWPTPRPRSGRFWS